METLPLAGNASDIAAGEPAEGRPDEGLAARRCRVLPVGARDGLEEGRQDAERSIRRTV